MSDLVAVFGVKRGSSLNPPAPPEEGKHGQYYCKHNAHDDLEGEWVVVGGEIYVHAEDAGDESEGEEDDRD